MRRLELQADFLAGVWAHHAQRMRDILEPGDIEEAIRAASAIGDDRLQKQSQGYVVPDSFTHGTSAQRVAWFRRGFASGDLRDGDTFNATDLGFEGPKLDPAWLAQAAEQIVPAAALYDTRPNLASLLQRHSNSKR